MDRRRLICGRNCLQLRDVRRLLSPEEGAQHAKNCWDKKLNCTESVLRGVCHAQGVELPAEAFKMATAFGGGIGCSEDICGALVGGVLAIGAMKGRTKPEEDRLPSYDGASKLHSWFSSRFGGTCCRSLNKSDFESQEHRVRCGGFVSEATLETVRILRE